MPTDDLFDDVFTYPDSSARNRYQNLVGLEEIQSDLITESKLLLNPNLLTKWSDSHYGEDISLIDNFLSRSPYFVFQGDVGTGKTELAETFPDKIARDEGITINLHKLSLTARGTGAVGEMTTFITNAFNQVIDQAEEYNNGRETNGGVILLIDEADSLAQTRETDQMHHEDRAGVNALIRGLDTISSQNNRLPLLVIMCTNRPGALDPAIKRRAARIFQFERPNIKQRIQLLGKFLSDTELGNGELKQIAEELGSTNSRHYGYSYSDITQKFLPNLLKKAVDSGEPISLQRALETAKNTTPSPPFENS